MKRVTIAASMALLFASTAWAQDEEARHLLHALPSPFIVYRDSVQKDLKLSDDQKQKLLEKLPDYLPETKKVLERVKNLKAGDREKEMQAHRQKSGEKFEAFLKEALTVDQLKRLQQLKLQYDLPSILLQPEIGKELKITDEQRKRFVGLVQEMQKKIEPLMKEAQSGGNQQEILTKVSGIRMDCTGKIEALLSDTQRKQWKEMLGKLIQIW